MSKQDALLAIHNFSKLKSLVHNAKIRSSLKFLVLKSYLKYYPLLKTCDLKVTLWNKTKTRQHSPVSSGFFFNSPISVGVNRHCNKEFQ